MKTRIAILFTILFILVGCGGNTPTAEVDSLSVTDGSNEQQYPVENLKQLGAVQANFEGVTYVGVPLASLLQDAGFDPATVSAVKATASDGFTANYERELVIKNDTIVAYSRTDGPLTDDDGSFRMVLPGQEGKLNPRHLVELRVYE
jgi:hypothetical protein